MGSFTEFECSGCHFHFRQILYREGQNTDGVNCLIDSRFCYICSRITKRHYTAPWAIAPELSQVWSGNTGRILDYLFQNSPLLFAEWPIDFALPSPKRIREVCLPLLSQHLIRITDEGIFLEEGVRERMEQYRSLGVCDTCQTPLVYPEICPECGGKLEVTRMGQCE